MPRNLLTLGLLLLVSGVANAQGRTYTVHSGDTISSLADRFGVSPKALVALNGLDHRHKLKQGDMLRLPSGKSSGNTQGTYAVRDGDIDWTIARKNGLSVAQLHGLNPGVNWNAIQPGQKLNVGGHAAKTTVAAKAATVKAGAHYTVREGDNDWTVASKLGVSAKTLRTLNPSTNFAHLQIGATLSIPGSTASAPSGQIKTRTVAIKGEDVVLRAEATSDSKRLATVDHGVRGKVLDRDGDWYRLKFASGRTGWMRGDFLRSATGSELAVREGFPAKATLVAAKPAPKKTVVAVAKPKPAVRKTLVAMLTPKPHVFSSRMVAMQRTAKAKTKPSAASRVQGSVASRAQSWRGVRYRYGAMSRNATDCSGFTTQVFHSVGVSLPRTSGEQASVGAKVDRGSLQAGDLVFFHTVRGKRVGHVGIYMGNGKFIHASSGGGKVMVSSLSDGYYNNRFVTARRIHGAKIQGQQAVKAAQKSQEEQKSLPDVLPDTVEDSEITR
ncbi:hypothetical protein BH11ARM2_BH11ARM2_26280 [soil metagenome]